MSDAATKEDKNPETAPVDPTPLCLLFGQGHQHFLERLVKVPNEPAPPSRGRGKAATTISAAECLSEALFEPWHREETQPFLLLGSARRCTLCSHGWRSHYLFYKSGTQHGANRLAAVGLATLTLVPGNASRAATALRNWGNIRRGRLFVCVAYLARTGHSFRDSFAA